MSNLIDRVDQAREKDAAEIARLTETLKRVNDRLEQVWGDAELALQCFLEDDPGEGMAALKSAVEGDAPIALTRLRAELERLREAVEAIGPAWDDVLHTSDSRQMNKAVSALRTALEGEEGK